MLLRWAIAALLVTAGLQLAVALLHRGVRWPRWSAVAAGAVVLTVVAVVAVGGPGRYVQTHGGASWVTDKLHALLSDSSAAGGGNGAGRLIIVSNNGRVELWREAARQSSYHRLAGTGAGTFPFTHYRFRTNGGVVKHAHSQWFNVLSELGVVGLVLFVAAMVLFVAAAVGNPFSRRRDPLHPLLVALQVGVIAFFVHISWDWDWDMAAIGTVAFVFVAVCASYRATRAADGRRRRHAPADDAPAGAAAEGPPPEETSEDSPERTLAVDDLPAGVTAETAAHAGWRAVAAIRAASSADTPGTGPAPRGAGDEPAAEEAGGDRAIAGDQPERPAADEAPGAASEYERHVGPFGAPLPPGGMAAPGGGQQCAAAAGRQLAAAVPRSARRERGAGRGERREGERRPRRTPGGRPRSTRSRSARCSPRPSLLQQQGRNQEALARLQAAAKLQPQNYEVWYELGVLLHGALGRDKAAKAALIRALALNPDDAASRYELELLAR